MRKVLLVLAAAALTAVAPAAAGRGEPGEIEFGPYAGFGWLDDYDGADPDPGPLFGGRVGVFLHPRWSIEGSYQRLATEADILSSELDVDLDAARLNVLFSFRPGESFRPFVTAGVGSEMIDIEDLGDSSDLGWNAGGGLRWYLTETFGIRADGRYVSVDVEDLGRQSNLEATVGVLWSLGRGGPSLDSDRDGVPDRKDACPETPLGAIVDARGCSTDADGDGIFDGIDKCPDTPKGWPVDGAGCPKDSDRDGVPDGADSCPDTPQGARVDAKGCPADADGDGVFDGLDKCPDTPRGATVDASGCPKDSDGDGVFDGLDKCPDTPRGTSVDAVGCPPPPPLPKAAPLFDEIKKTLVLEGVNFETNSAVLTADSSLILDRVAASLKDWPEVRVEVGGHTDSTGSDAHNLDLSQRRADSVRTHLAGKGVDIARLTSKGYGESQPVDTNNTKQGRAKNRRVELKKIE